MNYTYVNKNVTNKRCVDRVGLHHRRESKSGRGGVKSNWLPSTINKQTVVKLMLVLYIVVCIYMCIRKYFNP